MNFFEFQTKLFLFPFIYFATATEKAIFETMFRKLQSHFSFFQQIYQNSDKWECNY